MIDTTGGGRVVISVSDGSQIIIYPSSRIRIGDFSTAASLRELIEIALGRVRVRIQRLGRRPNPYRVTSPAATIAVRGTDFLVNVEASGETQVVVYEGLVEVASRFDPRQRTLVEQGRSVIVRPSGDISIVSAGPGSELNGVAKTHYQLSDPAGGVGSSYYVYIDGLDDVGTAPAPARFSAFADSYFDSLDNPAFATEFTQAAGRLYLLPSLSRVRQSQEPDADSPHRLDSALSAQAAYFLPVAQGRWVLGAGLALAQTDLRGFARLEPLSSPNSSATAALKNLNASLLIAHRLQNGRTSLGFKVDQTASRNSLTFDLKLSPQEFVRYETPTRADYTRLTFGLTHEFSAGGKVGLLFRHGFNRFALDDRALINNVTIDSTGFERHRFRTSELKLLWRGPLTRRLYYGVEASLLYEQSRALGGTQTIGHSRNHGHRASLGGGIGYAVRPRTVFSFDLAGGRNRYASRGDNGPDTPLSFSKSWGRFLSVHAGAQTDLTRRFFATGSFLYVRDWRERETVGRIINNSSRVMADRFANLGLGLSLRSTCIGEKVERRGLEAFGGIDGHASGLAVGPVGVDRHACRWCCVAAVSVSWWEWDVWHRSVAVSEVQPHKLDRML